MRIRIAGRVGFALATLFFALSANQAFAQAITWRVSTYGVGTALVGIAPQSLAFDANDNLYTFAYINDADDSGIRLSHDHAVDGSLLWQTDITPVVATAALATVAADAIVATTAYGPSNYYGQVARYRGSDGARLWQTSEHSLHPQYDLIYAAIAADALGNVVAAGTTGQTNITRFLGHVAKFRGDDGTMTWNVDVDPILCGPNPAPGFRIDSIVIDGNSDILLAGISPQSSAVPVCVVKLKGTDGSVLWVHAYQATMPNTSGLAATIIVDAQGNPTIGASYGSTSPSLPSGFALLRLDGLSGVSVWSQDPVMLQGKFISGASIALDASANVVLSEGATRKYSGVDGHLLWPQDAPVDGAVAIDSSGKIILAQNDSSDPSGPKMKFSAISNVDGTALWNSSFALGGSNPWSSQTLLAADHSGHFAALLAQTSFCCVEKQLLTLKGNAASGVVDWHLSDQAIAPDAALLAGPDPFASRSSVLTPDGGIVSVGAAYPGSASGNYNSNFAQVMAVKRSTRDGHLLWRAMANVDVDGCQPTSIALDGNADVVVAASCEDVARTIKFRGSDGQQLWVGSAQSTCNYAGGESVAVDAANDVYVTGWCQTDNADGQLTVKYTGTSGTIVWSQITAAGVANSSQFLVNTDSNGAVVIGAVKYLSGGAGYYAGNLTINKLNAVDGSLLWIRNIDPPATGNDVLSLMGIYPNGDVVVAGTGDSGTQSAVVARLNSADGSIKWLVRDAGEPAPIAMALPANGDIVFAGNASVWKYAGSNGSSGWTYTDPGAEVFNDVTLDHAGNVLTTGNCRTSDGMYLVLCVVAINTTSGAVAWRLLDNPAQAYATGIGVLVASDGGILVSANFAVPDSSPFSLLRITGAFADDIFAGGFEP